jgi:hypothetical protein
VHRTRDGQAHVRYSVVGRSGGQVTLCAVCTVHKETRSVEFLVWPQNWQLWFGDLCLKITTTVSWFGPKNKRASVCRLRHKNDGKRLARNTRQDLAACFT